MLLLLFQEHEKRQCLHQTDTHTHTHFCVTKSAGLTEKWSLSKPGLAEKARAAVLLLQDFNL